MKRFLVFGLLVLFGVLIAAFLYYPRLDLITGFVAKNVCSCTFEAGRDLRSIEEGDNGFEPVSYANSNIAHDEKWVTSTFLGLKERKAAYFEGIGCMLLPGKEGENIPVNARPKRNIITDKTPYPYGSGEPEDSVFPSVDYRVLNKVIDKAFLEANGSRAIVVLHKDRLLAEQYAPGFNTETKLLGWSMAKSITSAVVGVLEKEGRVQLEHDNLLEQWQHDDRSRITLNNLLQMNSGLAWEEDYTKISDVTRMLFLAEDMSEVQLQKSLSAEPGRVWNYSSGTSNLLSGYIRQQFNTHQDYLDFWYDELIDRIGMHSMVLETDAAGNYVGSSYAWATARDWAKFGLLYLHNGNWNGDQVIEPSWVEYTITPAEGSGGRYGGHFWLNAGGEYPNVPTDLFSANGFQGQYVFIIPSKDLVVVRFGLKEHPEFDVNVFLKELIEATTRNPAEFPHRT